MLFLIKKNTQINWKTISSILISSFVLVFVGYSAIEPTISKAVTDTFLVTQTISSEISFSTTASDVTMSNSIPGMTGGTASGQTQIGILTNENTGYSLSLKSTSSPSMQGLTQGGTIADYTPVSGTVPDYHFGSTTMASGAEFGYTVSASTTADLDQSFKDNGPLSCNTGSLDTAGSLSCWLNASTTDERILYRTTETASTSEKSTLYFKVTVNNNAFVVEDDYQATIILTATAN